ncbi:MAG: hypothetical protein ABSH44_20660 [Bryobacteraceae bacterium]|jgi:hypothetical protein
MKTIIRRLCRLEERSGIGNPDAIEQTRRLIEELEAGRRRAAEVRARVECDYRRPEEDDWESLVGLTRVEILERGRQRARERSAQVFAARSIAAAEKGGLS